MIGSSNKIAASALLALLLSSAAVFAAPDAPHVIAPSLDDRNDDDTANAPSGQMDTVAVAPHDTISESAVSTPPVEGFGILEQGKGALPEDVWKGSTRETADPLLKYLRSGVADPTLKDLTTRLLLTQATPPQGTAHDSWFVLRINALIALGQDDKADQLIASLPASMADTSLLELSTGLKLIRGEYDHACANVQPPTDAGGDDFWRKLAIVCKAHAGNQNEAMVGIDLMREERHSDDLFFQEAIRRIGDKNSLIKSSPKEWTLFNVALLRLAGDSEKLKANMDSFPPVALKYIAQDASLDIKLREMALARAQHQGVLPGNEENKTPEPSFTRPVASDVTTLVTALGSGKPANDADNAVIARLALTDAGTNDGRRIQRLLTLMEPFGYHVPPEIWQKLYAHPERYDGELPSASLVARITDAAATGRHGEVVLLAALITGNTDADKTSDLALLPVVKALILAGFEKEAREVAHAAVKGYSAR